MAPFCSHVETRRKLRTHSQKSRKNTYTQTSVKTAFSLLSKMNGKNKSSNRPVWFRTIFENASENKGEASISATRWWMGLFNGNWLINSLLEGEEFQIGVRRKGKDVVEECGEWSRSCWRGKAGNGHPEKLSSAARFKGSLWSMVRSKVFFSYII